MPQCLSQCASASMLNAPMCQCVPVLPAGKRGFCAKPAPCVEAKRFRGKVPMRRQVPESSFQEVSNQFGKPVDGPSLQSKYCKYQGSVSTVRRTSLDRVQYRIGLGICMLNLSCHLNLNLNLNLNQALRHQDSSELVRTCQNLRFRIRINRS